GKDRFYLAAIGIAVGHHDKARRDIILADFDKEFPEWNEKVANLAWELRLTPPLPQLEKRLLDSSLPTPQRIRVVDTLATSEDIPAGKILLQGLRSAVPSEVRDRILEHFKLSLAGKWGKLRDSAELRQTIARLLDQAETRPAALILIG